MVSYRIYCVDGTGSITTAQWIEAKDDEEAIALARAANLGMKCEVWSGNRFVGTIDGSPGAAPQPA